MRHCSPPFVYLLRLGRVAKSCSHKASGVVAFQDLMSDPVTILGFVCIVAAIAGGGLKLTGVQFPLIASVKRQLMLLVFGIAMIAWKLPPSEPDPHAGWYGFRDSPNIDREGELKARCAPTFSRVAVKLGSRTFVELCSGMGMRCTKACDWEGRSVS
jgi:hypothetical protein